MDQMLNGESEWIAPRGRGCKTATKAAETAKTATKTAKTVTKATKTATKTAKTSTSGGLSPPPNPSVRGHGPGCDRVWGGVRGEREPPRR